MILLTVNSLAVTEALTEHPQNSITQRNLVFIENSLHRRDRHRRRPALVFSRVRVESKVVVRFVRDLDRHLGHRSTVLCEGNRVRVEVERHRDRISLRVLGAHTMIKRVLSDRFPALRRRRRCQSNRCRTFRF